MGELSFTEKLIEQGFIVLGIALAIIIFWFLQKQNNKQTKEQLQITREVTSALIQSSESNEKLSRILDKNLEKMDRLPTRDDVKDVSDVISKKHEIIERKLDSIIKENRK